MRLASLIAVICLSAGMASAEPSADWQELIRQADQLDTNAWFDSAIVMGRQALASAEKTLGTDDLAVAAILLRLSDYFGNATLHDSSVACLTRAYAISKRQNGGEDSLSAEILRELGNASFWRDDLWKAESYYRKGITILEQLGRTESPGMIAQRQALAATYCSLGRHKEARKQYEIALRSAEQIYPSHHPTVLNLHMNRGICLRNMGNWDKAAEEEQMVMAEPFTEIENGTADDARTYMILAKNLIARGHYDKAEEAYRRALEIRERVLTPSHRFVGETLKKMGDLCGHVGRKAKADSLYTRAITIMRDVVPPENEDLHSAVVALRAIRESGN